MNINFDQVSFTYPSGVKALDNVSLAIRSGELVAIVGENGAGKTTLVKMLNALLRPEIGDVKIGDWNTAERTTAQLAARVGFLFQNPDDQLFERSVRREVGFGPQNLGWTKAKTKKQVSSALRQVGLDGQADVNPYDLPPHQRKLLALASTLAMETPILVLDEPSIGQDADGRKRIGRILQNLHKIGRTQLLISHDLDFCAEHAERVIVMVDGRILADGPAAEVLARSQTLAKAAVIPPQLVRLAQALKMPSAPLTVKDFLRTYATWHKRKKKKR
jgi:energy-coupling factor transport system ATP-binding protein